MYLFVNGYIRIILMLMDNDTPESRVVINGSQWANKSYSSRNPTGYISLGTFIKLFMLTKMAPLYAQGN